MDFTTSEEQDAIAELAEQVFTGATTLATVEATERSDDRFDRELWTKVAETGLLGVNVPEASGGLGFGAAELALVAEAHGASVSPIPLLPTVLAGRIIAAHGSDAQREQWLPGVVDGSTVLTVALEEWGVNNPNAVSVIATPAADGYTLSGAKPGVAAIADAARVVVPAATPDGEIIAALVDPSDSSVEVITNETTNYELQGSLTFADTPVAATEVMALGADGLAHVVAAARIGTSATVLGACKAAIATTVEHANTREQFGKPLAMNQSYSQRMADAAIDVDCIWATVTKAAWMLDAGLDAEEASLIAAWWAADGGSRVVHSTQHLHGGTGADISYPIHRYFLWVKQRANSMGTASSHLSHLGDAIASNLTGASA